jgi:hypothetical protein
MIEGSGSVRYLVLTDTAPDPRGPKTHGSYRSGPETLATRYTVSNLEHLSGDPPVGDQVWMGLTVLTQHFTPQDCRQLGQGLQVAHLNNVYLSAGFRIRRYSFDTDPYPAFYAEYRSGSNPDPGF